MSNPDRFEIFPNTSNEPPRSSLNLLNSSDAYSDILNKEPPATRLGSGSNYTHDPYYHPPEIQRSPNTNHQPPSDLLTQISFTLSMPVIIAAGFDLMAHNKNYSCTRSVLKTYTNACKFTGRTLYKGAKNFYDKDLKIRTSRAFKAFTKPIKGKEGEFTIKVEVIDP